MKAKQLAIVGLVVGLLGVAVLWSPNRTKPSDKHIVTVGQFASAVSNLATLLSLPATELDRLDIARMNLLCAEGLPGAEDLNVAACLATLDKMVDRVRAETTRHYYRFERNPAEFENSEGFYRMLIMAVVLTEDFQVKYESNKIGTAATAQSGDRFFADAHDVFLHGLTSGRYAGTCSSLPVLQVAVGRRLDYPLKLVTTKGHLFVRWEDAKEHFNIEAAGNGVNRFDDDYYRHWPFEVSKTEEMAEGYLKSLTPVEELGVFLSIRGMCWCEAGKMREATESFVAAAKLVPRCQSYQQMQVRLAAGR